ncbi:MAG: PAS domain-containing protein [Ktedonobacterales bacterium]|nr:PAS domain-containing protein [Ktedonobacterales bacterium]
MPKETSPEKNDQPGRAPRSRRAPRRRTDPLPRELGPLIEAMADGVIITNRHGRVVLTNAALGRLFAADLFPEFYRSSLKERSALLQPRSLDGHPIPPERWPANLALTGRSITSQDVLVRGLDGLDRILNHSATPIYDSNRDIIGVVTVYRDVTQQRRLEQMKDDFLSIAGHELRAPLTPILVAAQMAERRLQQPERMGEALPLVRDVIRYTQRLNALMAAVLDMTRIQGERLHIYPEPCDAAMIIREATDAETIQWRRPVTILCPDAGLWGEWDATRLWQVIANLVSNALKYSPPMSLVTVSAEIVDGDQLHIVVTDTGPGIPPEELPYLFERFYRGQHMGEGHREGLGLGLYITRAIVQAHDGHIFVNSVLGVGTTFTVRLPLHTPQPAMDAPPPAAS